MGKVYTRFQTKTAQKPYPMGRQIPDSLYKGVFPPPPGVSSVSVNHLYFFQDRSLSRERSWNFLSIALWCIPTTPFPGHQLQKLHTHTHSMTQTRHFLAQHSWKKRAQSKQRHPNSPWHLLNRKAISAAALFRKFNVLLHLIERAPTSSKSRTGEEEK